MFFILQNDNFKILVRTRSRKIYLYRLGRYCIDTLGCRIAILSQILLATNLVISRPAMIRSPHDKVRIVIQRSRYYTYRDTS